MSKALNKDGGSSARVDCCQPINKKIMEQIETEDPGRPVEVHAVPGRSAPPSYHNSPAPDKGPPPSYEEAIDPNGQEA
ncbi:hypothetical protein J6590_056689 [Homalodisca vitripennis]|nr:hypothetical protein J6590_105654 [Homalodisca vitripennis]KAG8306014.1 hypothetical protein J6590_056689 [Homalodisca vitripennis]